MEDFIFRNNLKVLNNGNRFTYVRYNAQSVIDVTLASPGIYKQIEHWMVNDAIAYSDHCSIQFILKVKQLKTELKWNFKKGNWPRFAHLMEGMSCPMLNDDLVTKTNEIGIIELQKGIDD